MPVFVPVFSSVPLYTEQVRLDGQDYILYFDWSNREQRWYLSISDVDNASLVAGLKVMANTNLLVRHQSIAALPQGALMAMDLETGGVPPAFADFGSRVRLFYYTLAEMVALQA